MADQGVHQIREYSTLSLAQSYLLRQDWQIRECRSGCTPDQGVQIRMYSRSGSGRSGSTPDQGVLHPFSGSVIPFEAGVAHEWQIRVYSRSGSADQGVLQIREWQIREYSTLFLGQLYLLRQEWQIRKCRSGCTPDQEVQIRVHSRSGSGRSGSTPPFPRASHAFDIIWYHSGYPARCLLLQGLC